MFCRSLISVMSTLVTLSVCIVLLATSVSTAPVEPIPTVPGELEVTLYKQEGCKGSEEIFNSIKLNRMEASDKFESECRSLVNETPRCVKASLPSMTDYDLSIELFEKDGDCRREKSLQTLPTSLTSTVKSFKVVAYPKSKST